MKLNIQGTNIKQTSNNEKISSYIHTSYITTVKNNEVNVTQKNTQYKFKTNLNVPKLGVMLVGWGGNNGSTLTASILANKKNLKWKTKEGEKESNFYGSVSQASTIEIGTDESGKPTHIPFKNLLPMVDPENFEITGWDISDANLKKSMIRAKVLDFNLQEQLFKDLEKLKPLPSIYYPDFIASNQQSRATNILKGLTMQEEVDEIRKNIRDFKKSKGLDKVIVLWTANTERFSDIVKGVNDTEKNLLESIKGCDLKDKGRIEISPSTLFAVASILEGCSYINGSPQNTFVPGVLELARSKKVFIGGDDFKSGQTKIKSVLVDFLVGAGIKPKSIVSYNHLGNNDGKNLSSPKQFRSKEISKTNVIDDAVESNKILYKEPNEHVDHCVVIKYVPFVGDSKRAMDEYTSEIFMGGLNTLVIHNTCEDSLLATPLIVDLIVFTELLERITWKDESMKDFDKLNSILSILSYFLKAPLVPKGTPVINALFKQRSCLVNFLRICAGLKPQDDLLLDQKLKQ